MDDFDTSLHSINETEISPEYGSQAAIAEDEVNEVKKLTKKESKGVWIWKFLVVVTTVATAALVSSGSYLLLRHEETNSFETSFYLFANTVRDASEFHLRDIMLSMKDLSNLITDMAQQTNQNFPFVTIPAFESMGESVRRKAGLEALYFAPLVNSKEEAGEWSKYSYEHQDWLESSRSAAFTSTYGEYNPDNYQTGSITPIIFDMVDGVFDLSVKGEPPYMPIWQASPPPFNPAFINYNAYTFASGLLGAISKAREGLFGWPEDLSAFAELVITDEDHDAIHANLVDWVREGANSTFDHPHSFFSEPVFEVLNDGASTIVGFLSGLVAWDRYLVKLLPDGVSGITCVLKASFQCSGCDSSEWEWWSDSDEAPVKEFTYLLDGNSAFYLGEGDMHERHYDDMEVVIPFNAYVRNSTLDVPFHTSYSFHVYPTKKFEEIYQTKLPTIIACVVASTFLFMTVAFSMYDSFVSRRNAKVIGAAVRSGAIVSSLFPSVVKERLYKEAEEKQMQAKRLLNGHGSAKWLSADHVEDGMDAESQSCLPYQEKPIADLFPETTILFTDIAGFTAWSSAREPHQVFTLLETLYHAFDEIARKRRVFKVETIGDCYVAVTGLPEPRQDHAVAMVKFARDCLQRMHMLVHQLEVVLGPDTAELDMRFGLHSGPVTAGVLRGERSRFQLFGDTMNTASRMESTGQRGKIQISQATADYLIQAGKTNWITPRQDKVVAKGKGEMQTFWVLFERPKTEMTDVTETSMRGSCDDNLFEVAPFLSSQDPQAVAKQERLVKWNVEVLSNLLRQIQTRRTLVSSSTHGTASDNWNEIALGSDKTVLDEVQEIINIPKFKGEPPVKPDSIKLSRILRNELKDYVSTVAAMYNENPFHNFEHASHVTASVVKLLSRIVAPDLSEHERQSENIASTLHDHTYGITSDPLTQFACAFSALIHDVDHAGVPNNQLLHENPTLASKYKMRSIAEQNSVDVALNLLMEERYKTLRQAIYQDADEQRRFRQLVINSVMATDIMDADSKKLRNARWEKAFSESHVNPKESAKEATDRKATIVIEHLLLASDVSHTMQHWHIYRKWNERLFMERYKAFREGRSKNDPSTGWYEGELGFFDNYIIPLAKKLHDCGVFGVSSDEYLDYAVKNRKEWELRGQEIVSEMVESMDDVFVERAPVASHTSAASSSPSRPTLVPQPSARSLALKSPSMHTPSSPVKRAIRFVAMNKQMSTDDLMEFMYKDHRKSEKRRSTGTMNEDWQEGEKSMGARLEL